MTYRAFELYDKLLERDKKDKKDKSDKEKWEEKARDYAMVILNRERGSKVTEALMLDYLLHSSKLTKSIISDYLPYKSASLQKGEKDLSEISSNYLKTQTHNISQDGIKVSKKTFQEFIIPPRRFYKVTHYKDIPMVNTYAGEKKGYLAEVFSFIVACTNRYDTFLDLFGGSGRVSMVVPKISGVDYFINEWNFTNVNYYYVLRNKELCKKLIEYIEDKQKELSDGKCTYEKLYEISDKIITVYEGTKLCDECINNVDVVEQQVEKAKNKDKNEQRQKCQNCDSDHEYSRCKKRGCYKKCKLYPSKETCKAIDKYTCNQTIEVWGKVLLDILSIPSSGMQPVYENLGDGRDIIVDTRFKNDIIELCRLYIEGNEKNENKISALQTNIRTTYDMNLTTEDKDKLRKYFNSENLKHHYSLSGDDKVEWAFSFLYKHSFIGQGGEPMKPTKESGKLQKMVKDFNGYRAQELLKVQKQFSHLTDIYNSDALDDLEFIIESFANRVPKKYQQYEKDLNSLKKDQLISDENLQNVIRLLGGKLSDVSKDGIKKVTALPRRFKTLLYCDSPYLNTRGYNPTSRTIEAGKADGCIDSESMGKLIARLINFWCADNDFIFSCRAGISKNNLLKNVETAAKKIDRKYEEDVVYPFGATFEKDFKWEDMVDLTKRDENSQLTVESVKGILESNDPLVYELLEQLWDICVKNADIYFEVFKKFEDLAKKSKNCKEKLYVVACIEKVEKFEQQDKVLKKEEQEEQDKKQEQSLIEILLKKLKVFEVFITNIEVPINNELFPSPNRSNSKYRFATYTLEQFNGYLRKYMMMSNTIDNWEWS